MTFGIRVFYSELDDDLFPLVSLCSVQHIINLHTLSSSSMGHWYVSSHPSYSSCSLAISPILTYFRFVFCASSQAKVDFPVPGVPAKN